MLVIVVIVVAVVAVIVILVIVAVIVILVIVAVVEAVLRAVILGSCRISISSIIIIVRRHYNIDAASYASIL